VAVSEDDAALEGVSTRLGHGRLTGKACECVCNQSGRACIHVKLIRVHYYLGLFFYGVRRASRAASLASSELKFAVAVARDCSSELRDCLRDAFSAESS